MAASQSSTEVDTVIAGYKAFCIQADGPSSSQGQEGIHTAQPTRYPEFMEEQLYEAQLEYWELELRREDLSPTLTEHPSDNSSYGQLSEDGRYPEWFINKDVPESQYRSYARYRLAGGRMKYRPEDTGTEEYHNQWPTIALEEGQWCEDYNKLAPCEHSARIDEYIEWYTSTNPKPTIVREAIRNWLDPVVSGVYKRTRDLLASVISNEKPDLRW